MDRTTKKILIGVAVLFLIVAGSGGFLLWQYGRNWFAGMSESARASTAEGIKWSESHSAESCLDVSLPRFARCDSMNIACSMRVGSFLGACLSSNRQFATFCTSVPSPTDSEAANSWGRAQCAQRHVNDPRCPILLEAVVKICHERPPAPR